MRFLNKGNYVLSLVFILLTIVLLQACGGDDNPSRVELTPPDPYNISNADSSYTTNDGLEVNIIKKGNGPFKVIARDQVSAYYTGRIIRNGQIDRVFDSTYRNGGKKPRVLRNLTSSPIVGSSGQRISPLVDGLRRAVIGMRGGGKRVVIVPPPLGYGDAQEGAQGYQFRNDTLRFDIELGRIL